MRPFWLFDAEIRRVPSFPRTRAMHSRDLGKCVAISLLCVLDKFADRQSTSRDGKVRHKQFGTSLTVATLSNVILCNRIAIHTSQQKTTLLKQISLSHIIPCQKRDFLTSQYDRFMVPVTKCNKSETCQMGAMAITRDRRWLEKARTPRSEPQAPALTPVSRCSEGSETSGWSWIRVVRSNPRSHHLSPKPHCRSLSLPRATLVAGFKTPLRCTTPDSRVTALTHQFASIASSSQLHQYPAQ